MFHLSKDEFDNLRSQFVTSSQWGGCRYPPSAFTEQGVAMLSLRPGKQHKRTWKGQIFIYFNKNSKFTYNSLVTFKGGMQDLITTLAAYLPKESIQLNKIEGAIH